MATKQATVTYKHIPDDPGYRVGDDGSVWTRLERKGFGRLGRYLIGNVWRQLKPFRSSGYLQVSLRSKRAYIHQLVLELFVGPRPVGFVACHGDGNSKNNRLENLRWDTPQANETDKLRHGTIARGEQARHAKLTAREVAAIRAFIAENPSRRSRATYMMLGAKYGVHFGTIRHIIGRRSWKHVL